MRQEPGVDLRHPREQALLVHGERVPGLGVLERRERLALWALARLGRAQGVERRQLGVRRDEAHRLLARQRLLAHRLVAPVEAALEPVAPLLGHVVRRVGSARRVVQEERLVGRDRLGVLDELERLVRQVLGQVVALLRGPRRIDRMVVIDQVGKPLVGLGAQEPIPALEATAAGPVATGRREVHLDGRAEVPLAHHVGVPAELAQDLRQHPVLGRDRAAGVGIATRGLGDAGHAVAGVVAACQQAGARWRAEGRRVPLRVAHALGRDAVDVGRLDRPAVGAHRREADVVEHDVHDARRAGGRHRRLEGRPIGHRVPDIDVDGALERRGHAFAPPAASPDGSSPTTPGRRRTRLAG